MRERNSERISRKIFKLIHFQESIITKREREMMETIGERNEEMKEMVIEKKERRDETNHQSCNHHHQRKCVDSQREKKRRQDNKHIF